MRVSTFRRGDRAEGLLSLMIALPVGLIAWVLICMMDKSVQGEGDSAEAPVLESGWSL